MRAYEAHPNLDYDIAVRGIAEVVITTSLKATTISSPFGLYGQSGNGSRLRRFKYLVGRVYRTISMLPLGHC